MSIKSADWENILDDIKAEKAVLLIGPEVMHFQDKPLNKYLKDKMYESNKDDIAYYYERDGVFLFSSPEGKVRVARNVKRFYRNLKPDESILSQIAQIPFHLMVSLNPDRFLSDIFYRNGIKHRFYYFQNRERDNNNTSFERPTRYLPVIYNLFGFKDQDDSLILDYDDIYKMLKSAFGTPGLPDRFMKSFGEARTYIFIGFQFDKWYSQLLLKFLSDGQPRDKLLAVKTKFENKDIEGFIITEFKINFFEDQYDFFGQLFQKCQKENILRKLSENQVGAKGIEILQKIANNEKLYDALEILYLESRGLKWENETINLKARYTSIEERLDRGIIENSHYNIERNKIVDSIIEHVNHNINK